MYLDLLLLFMVLVFACLGYIQGFLKQMITLFALIGALFFAQPLALWLKFESGWTWASEIPTFILWGLSSLSIFCTILLIGGLFQLARKNPFLKPTDRLFGLGLGAIKGMVVGVLLCSIYQVLPESSRTQYPDLHQDAGRSYFVKASASMMEWNWVGMARDLKDIQKEFQSSVPEVAHKQIPKTKPWQVDLGADRD